MQVLAERLDLYPIGVRVEIAGQDDNVPRTSPRLRKARQLPCCGLRAADPAHIDGDRTVVIREEHESPGWQVLQTEPLHCTLPVLAVRSHVPLAVGNLDPAVHPEGCADRPVTHDGVAACDARRLQHPPPTLAFLEGHDVLGHRQHGSPDLVDDTHRVVWRLEGVVPHQVVRHHPQLHWRTSAHVDHPNARGRPDLAHDVGRLARHNDIPFPRARLWRHCRLHLAHGPEIWATVWRRVALAVREAGAGDRRAVHAAAGHRAELRRCGRLSLERLRLHRHGLRFEALLPMPPL
mmetsp:Transcript_31169/g.85752  ORF Transcript_31169/g.85752 Transcript_31169/m.85752 type:complete len:292 (+) Transcript_31169:602-1477(+)